ncbi:MAG: multiheme c-type cytochrome [Pseudomonadota bacterium]
MTSLTKRTVTTAAAIAISAALGTNAMAQSQWESAPADMKAGDKVITFTADPDLKEQVSAYLKGEAAEAGTKQVSQAALPATSTASSGAVYSPPGSDDPTQALALALEPVKTATLSVAEQNELVVPRDPHVAAYKTSPFPSAVQCAECHQKIFWEWASSNHAYASISPMFHKFEQRLNTLASGTVGTFCVRCHQQIGTQLGEQRETPLWERSQIAREGITCVTCHRVGSEFGRVNGERHIRPGTIYEPMIGAGNAPGVATVLADKDRFNVSKNQNEDGSPIHTGAIAFEDISKSEFCVSCHQVAVHPGIKLEVVYEQYRASPAASLGIQCQECHMGRVQGVALKEDNYEKWPVAIVNGRIVGDPNRDHKNHAFYGPGYPIAHPGIFPFNPRALKWKITEWLQFNHREPWGVPEWEDQVAEGLVQVDFPDAWSDRVDRETARYVIDQNQRMLELKRQDRIAVMENGSRIDGPFFENGPPKVGETFKFRYRITNLDEGHNLPSGSLGAQPEIWANVVLTDPDGEIVFESGYTDSIGDMVDLHSTDLAAGKIEHDDQLVNLQTKFLVTGVKGPDREMYLPVNFDVDQIPHIRPSGVPSSVLNHPPLIRMEGRSIPPLGYRDANYTVDGDMIKKPGTYRLQFRMRSRAEPMYFMRFVLATQEMERTMNEWMIDIHPSAVEFEVTE